MCLFILSSCRGSILAFFIGWWHYNLSIYQLFCVCLLISSSCRRSILTFFVWSKYYNLSIYPLLFVCFKLVWAKYLQLLNRITILHSIYQCMTIHISVEEASSTSLYDDRSTISICVCVCHPCVRGYLWRGTHFSYECHLFICILILHEKSHQMLNIREVNIPCRNIMKRYCSSNASWPRM